MDSDHFEETVTRYYGPLYKFAFSLTGTEADAADLTQETFFIFATRGHQLRNIEKVKTWLFTTLHRTFLAMRRRQVRFPHHSLDEAAVDELPDPSPDFVNQLDSSQVLSALARVDEVYQAAVALFYLEDCSYKEIAEIIQVPNGTVKSRIARGIAQLRKIFLSAGPRQAPETPTELLEEERARATYTDQLPVASVTFTHHHHHHQHQIQNA